LQLFVVQLGAAMNAAGEPAYSVQERLTRVARAYGADAARIMAFPTYMMVALGRGEPAALELTSALAPSPRLDQIAALDRLVNDAERGEVALDDAVIRLNASSATRSSRSVSAWFCVPRRARSRRARTSASGTAARARRRRA
jgi:uncharacterized membrane protein YjjP (DUF1212 family)